MGPMLSTGIDNSKDTKSICFNETVRVRHYTLTDDERLQKQMYHRHMLSNIQYYIALGIKERQLTSLANP